MDAVRLDLALKKQRLQLVAASLRTDIARHGSGLAPVFKAADRVVDGTVWVRHHPQVLVAAAVALAVAKPKRAWRWGRRAFIGWQTWRRLQDFLEPRQPV